MSDPVATLLREVPLLPGAADLAASVERLVQAAKVGRVGSKAWPEPGVYAAVKDAFEAFREELRALALDRFRVNLLLLVSLPQVGDEGDPAERG